MRRTTNWLVLATAALATAARGDDTAVMKRLDALGAAAKYEAAEPAAGEVSELGPNSVLPARREPITLTTADGLTLVGELALLFGRYQ